MGKITLRIDEGILLPWKCIMEVLNLTPAQFVERLLEHAGQYATNRACLLDELVSEQLHVSRASATAVAQRMEVWAIEEQLCGRGALLSADVVAVGNQWTVVTDYLTSSGWLSRLPEFYDGEQWREAE